MSDRISSHTVGYKLHGFVFKKITPLPQVRSVALELEHEKTGARILHLHNDDTENLFSINFPTPPADDTGVPHILEHAVLSGSRKYPVRDPFFEMVKMSMATFINAMTGWDATYYPVTSNVKKDLFNLAEVYFDAVFHPLLTEETFQREGHHLAPVDKEKPEGDLKITGIVYNEMKGAFSSPEAVLYRQALRHLLPDTFYRFESGGDPESIPDLTWEGLRRFHATYYHPSNAMFVLYGDITTADFLAFLNGRLTDFTRQEIPVQFVPQPRWTQVRRMEQEYPVSAEESLEEKTFLAVSWLVGRGDDLASVALWQVVSEWLAGNEGAPLKMALIDSHLGDDLCWAGFMGIGFETAFSVALKGSEADRVEKFETLLGKILADLASKPVDPALLEAAFHQVSYRYLEIKSQYPLHMLDGVLSGWVYGTPPEEFLRMGEHIAECQRRVQADPLLIPNLIRHTLLDNPHRLTLTLRPSREVQGRRDAQMERKMGQLRATLTDEQARAIAARAAEIEGKAGDPNPPEAVALLPQLRVGDLPASPRPLPVSVSEVEGVTLLRNDVFSNGVNYVYLDFDLEGLPAELWPYLPHYTESVEKCGADGLDYEEVARRMSASTGSLSCWTSFSGHAREAGKSVLRLRANMKALDAKMSPAMDIYGKVLFGTDPGSDRERLLDVLTQLRAHCRTEFVENGLSTAQLHALRGMGEAGALDEMVHGLPQLALVEELAGRFETHFETLTAKIAALRNFLSQKGRLRVSFTGSDAAFETVRSHVAGWARAASPTHHAPFRPGTPGVRTREGLAAPVQVAHCAQAMPAPHHSHADNMLLSLGMHLMKFDYFLSEIRFKGNAYGAYGTYNGLGGNFLFSSYRDPHIVRTLEVFAKVGDFVSQVGWGQADVDRAIIALAKNTEPPMRPASVTDQVLTMDRCGITQEMREENYARMLRADPREVKRALEEHLLPALAEASICVVSSREKLEEANARLGAGPLAIENILKG